MARKTPLSPGQKVKISGQYELTGPRGGRQGREATLTSTSQHHQRLDQK